MEITIFFDNFFVSDAPLYISNPHFYQCDTEMLDAIDGLKPEKEKHGSYLKIQPVSIINIICLYYSPVWNHLNISFITNYVIKSCTCHFEISYINDV